ncbi:MAG TPA: MaoC family dehydratase N-terminal domain-containing protein [Sporosarcina psychrophila]|uniref:MaoC family dehydratase N-terminal domain-containing protein n=1 Tax=Sporosarcina psychrophila TaxID=1476 RepID=A0A921KBL3_SPOPS|nr:MaoC family dehydratase N-terminal domain-containing protein [Sporosarcina psychrophila]
MNTEKKSFLFQKERVQEYVRMLGDLNPVYDSKESARKLGFRTIPVPPAMPMNLYKLFEIPWMLQAPVILRKQQCINHQRMYIGETYTGFISLTDVKVRKGHTFSKQTLFLYNAEGDLCFSGISHLVASELA